MHIESANDFFEVVFYHYFCFSQISTVYLYEFLLQFKA